MLDESHDAFDFLSRFFPMLFHDKHTQKTRNGWEFPQSEKGHILKHQTYR